jgi:hypothetical protein
MPLPFIAAAAEPLAAAGLSEAAALTSSAFARRALQKQLMEAATKGAAAVGLGTGAAGLSELISPSKKKHEQSRMGSNANIDKDRIGKGGFEAKPSAKRAKAPSIARKPAGEYVAPSSVESAQTAGIQGLPGGQSGVSQEAGSDYGRTTYFGDTPESATQVAQKMRKGLFGEDISQEDYDAMTQRNKDASFYGRFKKGGQVKKKPAKKMSSGGSVSSASKRGDGCAQRGKTKGRMV